MKRILSCNQWVIRSDVEANTVRKDPLEKTRTVPAFQPLQLVRNRTGKTSIRLQKKRSIQKCLKADICTHCPEICWGFYSRRRFIFSILRFFGVQEGIITIHPDTFSYSEEPYREDRKMSSLFWPFLVQLFDMPPIRNRRRDFSNRIFALKRSWQCTVVKN